MHRFSSLLVILATALTTLLSTHFVHAQSVLTQATTSGINTITVACNDLRSSCADIDVDNVVFTGQVVASGLTQITGSLNELALGLKNANPGPFDDSEEIIQALDKLLVAQENLFTTIISKHTVLVEHDLKTDIQTALVAFVSGDDFLADELAILVSGPHVPDFFRLKDRFDDALEACIAEYS